MFLAHRTLRNLRTPALAVPLMLALGGCAAAPLMELAASGSGTSGLASSGLASSGLANVIRQAVPGMPGNTATPCAAGTAATTTGCSDRPYQAAATQATTDAAADAQAPACGQDNAGTTGAGCGPSGTPTLLQNLTGSLQKLVTGSSLAH